MRKIYLLAVFIFLSIYSAYSSHVVGAEMTYKNIGENQYKFTLKIFRDCAGIQVAPTYQIEYGSLTCNKQGNFKVYQMSKQEVSPVCESQSSTCVPGGTNPGIEMYIYEGTVTLPGKCSDWVFSWNKSDEYRNQAITNILDPDKTSLYIEAKLNNLAAPTNSSPIFGNIPVSYLTLNQKNSINPGTIDPDNNSTLVYKAINPKSSKTADVKYKSTFSATNPISSEPKLSINSSNGAISMYPTGEQISVTAILVEEYQNGVLIGSIVRDIQLIARDESNNNPQLSGIDGGTSKKFEICAGHEVSFSIFATDPDKTQKLKASWNESIPDAEFTITGPDTALEAKFKWTPPVDYSGTSVFTITAKDDHCPVTGQATETYEIVVNTAPNPVLPDSVDISCNDKYEIKPTISGGVQPFQYRWSSGETTPTVKKGKGLYSVLVTDAKGCSSQSDTIKIKSPMRTNFNWSFDCAQDTIHFTDSSIAGSKIIKWSWNFGDPASGSKNFSNLQNPTHIYSGGGIYDVKLTIEDDKGCKDDTTKKVKVCEIPKVDFVLADSCKFKTLDIIDMVDVKYCGIQNYRITVKGQVVWNESFPNLRHKKTYYPPTDGRLPFYFTPSDTGWHEVTVSVINEYGCTSSLTKKIYVHDNPYIEIVEPSGYYQCNNPDVEFHYANPKGGTPPLNIFWSDGTKDNPLKVDSIGKYFVTIVDKLGCDTSVVREIADPIVPKFARSLYCKNEDVIKFTDYSLSGWGIKQWDWIMGDGKTVTKTNPAEKNISYRYAEDGIYTVMLKLTDNVGCEDTLSLKVNQVLIDEHFSVTPKEMCLGTPVSLESPKGKLIDSLIWTMGNGLALKQSRTNLNYNSADGKYFYNWSYTYPAGSGGNKFPISLTVLYNKYMPTDTLVCKKEFRDTVTIFKEFKVFAHVKDGCTDDMTLFGVDSIIGNPISNISWKFYHSDHDHSTGGTQYILLDSSKAQSGEKNFTEEGSYYADIKATNTDKCAYNFTIPFNKLDLPEPGGCPSNLCAQRQTQFFSLCGSFGEGRVDSVHWDFGDPASGDNNTSTNREPFHIYSDSGVYQVKIKIFNTAFGCKDSSVMDVPIAPLPVPDFISSDPVCIDNPIQFTDKSITLNANNTINSWNWSFGDGDSSTVQNPNHIYSEPGIYDVSLYVAIDGPGCTDTITKAVQVYPNPTANFSYIENELIAGRPIKFFDESMGGNKWLWSFGDGSNITITDALNSSPEHTYSSRDTAIITQIVLNEFGCSDTLTKALNLKTYLLIPTAFSPNGDGHNDSLNLIYKGIDELLEFRIYNRWGELIFDANGNLNASWDGKYKDKDQPVGTFVYYIKARTFLDEQKTMSGKITLIR